MSLCPGRLSIMPHLNGSWMCMVRPIVSRSESAVARLGCVWAPLSSSSPPTWIGPEVALPLLTTPITEWSWGLQNMHTSGGDKITSLRKSCKTIPKKIYWSNGGNVEEEKENTTKHRGPLATERPPRGFGMTGHLCVELQVIIGGLPVGRNVEPCVKGKSDL